MTEDIPVTVRFTPEQFEWLDIHAVDMAISMPELLRQLVESAMADD